MIAQPVHLNHPFCHIVVDDGLLDEMGVIILSIQIECPPANVNLQLGAEAVVPGFLLPDILVDDQLAATGHQIAVLCQNMGRAIAFAHRAA